MALRIRVSNSAMGSVCDIKSLLVLYSTVPLPDVAYSTVTGRWIRLRTLPAGLDHSRQRTAQGVLARTQPAHLEAPIECARASAQRTAVVLARLELGRAQRLYPQTGLRHL